MGVLRSRRYTAQTLVRSECGKRTGADRHGGDSVGHRCRTGLSRWWSGRACFPAGPYRTLWDSDQGRHSARRETKRHGQKIAKGLD
jgi:hypothetical protein